MACGELAGETFTGWVKTAVKLIEPKTFDMSVLYDGELRQGAGVSPRPCSLSIVRSRGRGEARWTISILNLKAVGKRFPGVVALRDVSLDDRGAARAHVLLGENGAGKSTLINLLAGIYPPTKARSFLTASPTGRARRPTPIASASASCIRN